MNAKYFRIVSIVSLILPLLLAMPAVALSDDFTSYTNTYVVLDNTAPQGWVGAYDTSSITAGSLVKNDGASFRAHADVASTAENRASVHKDITSKNISNYLLTNGKLYAWFHSTNVTGISSVKIRLSSSTNNYFEYTNSQPFGSSFIQGAQLLSFNLTQPSSTVGSPDSKAINRIQLIVNYTSVQPAFDFTINRIWVEKSPTAFLSKWHVPFFGGRPDGWALPYSNESEGKGMSLTSTDIPSLGFHGRAYYRAEPTANDPSFTTQTNVRIVNAQWGARLFFDFVDGFNFSSVFLTNQWDKVGVESYVNGVRTYSQVPFDVIPGQTYTVKYIVNGTLVKVYVNNVYMLQWNVPSRRAGELGLESFQGTSHFSQFSYT